MNKEQAEAGAAIDNMREQIAATGFCQHSVMFDFPCGEHDCATCGERVLVGCDGDEGRCKVCTASAART